MHFLSFFLSYTVLLGAQSGFKILIRKCRHYTRKRSTILDLYACRRICLKNDWNRMEFLLTFGYFKFARF